jgi:peptidoglycan/LPS O-acetylase OafA/YrhL
VLAASDYSPELEALRGVAILLVFAYHASSMLLGGYRFDGSWVSPAAAFPYAGHTGVTLFFVLSAFLLSRPFLAEARGEPPVDRAGFFRRRARRILPAYLAAVAVGTLASASQASDLLRGLPHLLFLSGLPGVPELFPYGSVWWSLGTEVQFYLLLPLLPVALRAPRTMLAACLVYAALFAALSDVRSVALLGTRGSLLWRAPSFAAGIAAAFAYERLAPRWPASPPPRWLSAGGADLVLLALLAALGFLLRWVVWKGYFAAEHASPEWHALEALLWASIVLWVLVAPVRSRPLLRNPALEGVGRLSYSIYLTHLPILFFALFPLTFGGNPPGWELASAGRVLAAFAACLALSAATYRFVERPFLARRRRPTPGAPAAGGGS